MEPFYSDGQLTVEYSSDEGVESSSLTVRHTSLRSDPSPSSSPPSTACHLIPAAAQRPHTFAASELSSVRSHIDSGMLREFGAAYQPTGSSLPLLIATADGDGDGKIIDGELLEFGYAVLPVEYARLPRSRHLIRLWLWC